MRRVAVVIAAVVLVGIAGFFLWRRLDEQLARRALAAQTDAPRLIEKVGVLPGELRESSGVAVSRSQPGVLWSHNDSGDRPLLYAIDLSGKLLAKIPVANALARDWEDITLGPCPRGGPADATQPGQSCIYIADTGDNNQVRPEVTIYVVVEPQVSPGSNGDRPAPAWSFRYRYPGGANDCEAVAVQPNGDITLVSKGRTGTIDFFTLSADSISQSLTSGSTIEARYGGNTGIKPDPETGRLATSAAVSPDGKALAVRTYYEVYFFSLEPDGEQSRWRSLRRPCSLGDAEPQGEAIDYLDANTLLLTSETSRGRQGTIHRVQC